MSYIRVIPRDLFNESSLLKCYGRLYIVTEGRTGIGFPIDNVDSFDIIQRQDDGFLFIDNLPFEIYGIGYRLTRPLNSREAWPLYAERIGDLDFDAVRVFDDEGNLSVEMVTLMEVTANA